MGVAGCCRSCLHTLFLSAPCCSFLPLLLLFAESLLVLLRGFPWARLALLTALLGFLTDSFLVLLFGFSRAARCLPLRFEGLALFNGLPLLAWLNLSAHAQSLFLAQSFYFWRRPNQSAS